MTSVIKKYFTSSIMITLLGLVCAFVIGGIPAVFIVAILGILEVSLSFDNAIVNCQVLKSMSKEWQHRFITWGMLIAVLGMRLLFPLVIVSVMISVSPWAALLLAIEQPDQYKDALISAHTSVSGFGGTFLLMVALKFFIDNDKEVHWLDIIENKLTVLGKIEAIQAAITLAVVYSVSLLLNTAHSLEESHAFLIASIWGLVTYICVDGIGAFIVVEDDSLTTSTAKSGIAGFLYLEVLDSTFSFDGVLASFAISNNLFIIAIGLGIGAMFVRSLTLLMIDNGTVDEFRYLEHGAFYSIISLSIIMFASTLYEIPEVITGSVGAGFIILALMSSVKYNKNYCANS